MKLNELVEKMEFEVRTGGDRLDVEVTKAYASDLLSDVMAHAAEGAVWVTLQTHQNIVAVAVMKSLAAIILVNGREPDAETIAKARTEKIPILVSQLAAFELAGRLFGFPRPTTHGYTAQTHIDVDAEPGRTAVRPYSRTAVKRVSHRLKNSMP